MIGLFGGSFDPIHHGHLIVAQAVLESLELEELRFVPAHEQPFKRGRHAATPELRARMVELAIAGQSGFRLERAELDRQAPSYTVDTLRALRDREPGHRFALLIGADAAADLRAWREAEALPGLAQLVVLTRPGVVAPRLPWAAREVQVPAIDISATEIRSRVAAGLPIRYWTPDPVVECIRREGLYFKDA